MTDEELGQVAFIAYINSFNGGEWEGKEFHGIPPLERMAFVQAALAVKDAVMTDGMRTMDMMAAAARAALLVLSGVKVEPVTSADAFHVMHSMTPGYRNTETTERMADESVYWTIKEWGPVNPSKIAQKQGMQLPYVYGAIYRLIVKDEIEEVLGNHEEPFYRIKKVE